MKNKRLIAALLAANLTVFGVVPAAVLHASAEEPAATEEGSPESYKAYTLRTELVDPYNKNVVRLWLDLDARAGEGVIGYNISLRLTDKEGSVVVGRAVNFEFDDLLKDAQIKNVDFDPQTQILKIYVAGTQDLVQSANGSTNQLPIGTLSVSRPEEGAEQTFANPFRILLSGNTGELVLVYPGLVKYDVAENKGADFKITVDGTTYGEDVSYPVIMNVSGNGTIQAYAVTETAGANGTKITSETLIDPATEVAEGTKVRLQAIPAPGYRLTNMTLEDELNNHSEIELNGDFTFTVTSVVEVTAVFSPVEELCTVAVSGENASIVGATESSATFQSREVVTVKVVTVPEGKVFARWINADTNATMSDKETYSFAVTSDINLAPEFVDQGSEVKVEAAVSLNGGFTVQFRNGMYRLSFAGSCFLPEGCTLVEKGIILTDQSKETAEADLENFVKDGKLNGSDIATCAVSGENVQFISNVNQVAAGQTRTARAYLTYMEANGNTHTIYSDNIVELMS